MKEFRFQVTGNPVPQGSKTARVMNGRAVMFEANKKLPIWRAQVSDAARGAGEGFDPFTGPVRLVVTFFMERPKKPKWVAFPASKPDLDKLIRAVCDGITAAGIWADDSLVVKVEAQKLWAGIDGNPPNPGCFAYIAEL